MTTSIVKKSVSEKNIAAGDYPPLPEQLAYANTGSYYSDTLIGPERAGIVIQRILTLSGSTAAAIKIVLDNGHTVEADIDRQQAFLSCDHSDVIIDYGLQFTLEQKRITREGQSNNLTVELRLIPLPKLDQQQKNPSL
ncbi:hypothetical protein [Pseudomonas sp. UM16]|uniref:hypothetical protein n=1 Tax=Pseudomonas sp. UM16 TaxID=3158962 RepID=UPI00398F978E